MGFIGSNYFVIFFLRFIWLEEDAPLELKLLFTCPLDFRLLESIADHVSVPDSDGAAGLLFVVLLNEFYLSFNYLEVSFVTLTHYCLKSVMTNRVYKGLMPGPSIGLSTPSSSI